MIRYFEKQGLIPAAARSEGGYRSYSENDVCRMRTISLAQDVGFPASAIAKLIAMMDKAETEREDPCAEVEALAELDRKTGAIAELRGRIRSIVDRARSRLPDEMPDNDWAPDSVGDPRRSIEIVVVRAGAACRSTPRSPVTEPAHKRERALTSAN